MLFEFQHSFAQEVVPRQTLVLEEAVRSEYRCSCAVVREGPPLPRTEPCVLATPSSLEARRRSLQPVSCPGPVDEVSVEPPDCCGRRHVVRSRQTGVAVLGHPVRGLEGCCEPLSRSCLWPTALELGTGFRHASLVLRGPEAFRGFLYDSRRVETDANLRSAGPPAWLCH